MKSHPEKMPILRLAYISVFLLALIAVFTLWSQVGGQGHLDLVPWSIKLVLGCTAAYGITRAGAAAVAGEHGWNGQSVKWTGVVLAALLLCGLASLYAHNNLEDNSDEDAQDDANVSSLYDAPSGFDRALQLPRVISTRGSRRG